MSEIKSCQTPGTVRVIMMGAKICGEVIVDIGTREKNAFIVEIILNLRDNIHVYFYCDVRRVIVK